MAGKLVDRTAIVTGASSGIGEATARQLAEAGAAVVLAARRRERLEALREEIENAGGRALAVTADVTDRAAVGRMVERARERFGSVDVLVNNAGLMPLSFVKNLHEDEWQRMVDVNLKGVLHCVGAVLPVMLEQQRGHIVNVSSVAGKRVFPAGSVYCATKFAVRALSEGLRLELTAEHGIRITDVEPGAVTTELTQTITDDAVHEMFAARQFRRLDSDDVARAILYAVTTPDHVDVAELLIMPSEQG